MPEIQVETEPNEHELKDFLENCFSCVISEDSQNFTKESDQTLDEWFSVADMIAMLPTGKLLTIRDEKNGLLGIAFVAKQHPITWPDGHKAELFILAVHPERRKKGFGKMLLLRSEKEAKKIGAAKLFINTNSLMNKTVEFYKKNGFVKIGLFKDYYDNGDAVFLAKTL
ncbi:MAG TPA: N-acetyltransferase [Patescibacteria group bacterium]|nr:N-acetyltransferase [Patescibacteria group bacterium]